MRKNFTLIYELLDEVMDYGVPQSTGTEALKTFVLNEPVVLSPSTMPRLLSFSKGPTGVFKSVLDTSRTDGGKRRDEIFVDVVERVTCTFNASGFIVSSQVGEMVGREGAAQGESKAQGRDFCGRGGEGDVHLHGKLFLALRPLPFLAQGDGRVQARAIWQAALHSPPHPTSLLTRFALACSSITASDGWLRADQEPSGRQPCPVTLTSLSAPLLTAARPASE